MKWIKVEDGVKMPKNKVGRKSGDVQRYVWPWDVMRIGQSFVFPDEMSQTTCRTMAQQAQRRYRRWFTVRMCKDGLRCWRIG